MKDIERRLAALERRVNKSVSGLRNIPADWGMQGRLEIIKVGKLNEPMYREGKASVSIWSIDPLGGMKEDTGKDLTAIDPGQISFSISPLPEDTNVTIGRSGKYWILVSVDCPDESSSSSS